MKTCIRIICSLALLIYLSIPAYGQQTLLWKVSGNGLKKDAYLFGTHHLVPGSFLESFPKAAKHLRKSKNVVVEVVIDSSKIAPLNALMLQPDGPGWIGELSPSTRKSLDSVLNVHMGASIEQLAVLRPAAISTILSLSLTQAESSELLKKYKGLPLDASIAAKATKRKQSLIELESLEQQFNLLYVQPPLDSQIADLNQMVTLLDSVGPYSRQLITSYLQQDVAGMQKMLSDYSANFGGMEKLLDERNAQWMQQLPGIFESGSSFVAVGALHLFGENGLIDLLQKAGYEVTPVKNRADESTTFETGMDMVMWIALIIVLSTADAGTVPKTAPNHSKHG